MGLVSDGSFNPFSTRFVRPDRMRYRFTPDIDPERFAQSLADRLQKESALAVIGPHGTGKTTLLHFLMPRLEAYFGEVRFVRLCSSSKPFGPPEAARLIAGQALVVIDGYEQLSVASRVAMIARLKCLQLSTRLLITAHRRQWFVPTFFCTRWDAKLVSDLTAEKLADLPREQRFAMQQIADQLARRYPPEQKVSGAASANVRDYWFSLYDAYERLRNERSTAGRGTARS
ncbi:MAG TPA: hypothetical protein DDZ51_31295 [Planctomycetaceae bacterium]|nr:hypothetical protein [Planctomycetaceae bacterium]